MMRSCFDSSPGNKIKGKSWKMLDETGEMERERERERRRKDRKQGQKRDAAAETEMATPDGHDDPTTSAGN
jgi:hypothetical protein